MGDRPSLGAWLNYGLGSPSKNLPGFVVLIVGDTGRPTAWPQRRWQDPEVTEQDAAAHRVVMTVKSREAGGQGYANATIAFDLNDGGGNIHTNAQITGKAASMGEGVVSGVLDALVKDFAGKLGKL